MGKHPTTTNRCRRRRTGEALITHEKTSFDRREEQEGARRLNSVTGCQTDGLLFGRGYAKPLRVWGVSRGARQSSGPAAPEAEGLLTEYFADRPTDRRRTGQLRPPVAHNRSGHTQAPCPDCRCQQRG